MLKKIVFCSVLCCSLNVIAASSAELKLVATGSLEVPHDWIQISLMHEFNSSSATRVKDKLNEVGMAARLLIDKLPVNSSQVRYQPGVVEITPIYDKGKITQWVGRYSLSLEGSDYTSVQQLAQNMSQFNIRAITYSLSPSAREQSLDDLEAIAVKSFKRQAESLTAKLGYASYSIKEAVVNHQRHSQPYQPYRAAKMNVMAVSAMADQESAPILSQPGVERLEVTMSGAVLLQK